MSQPKDFAELVDELIEVSGDVAHLEINGSQSDIGRAREAREKARSAVINAYTLSTHSEDFATLRDSLAMAALTGMTANSAPGMVENVCVGDFNKVAGWAYMHADAMIEARKVTP